MSPCDEPEYSCRFRVADFVGEVSSNDCRFLSDFRKLYYEEAEPADAPQASYYVFVARSLSLNRVHYITGPRAGDRLLISAFYPSLLPALERSINQQVIRALDTYCLVRAGFIASRGKGFLVAGGIETGRNLLVKTLVERGFTYFGDGIAILNMPKHEALHFPKSIAVERPANPITSFRRTTTPFRERERTAFSYLLPDNRARGWRESHRIDVVLFPERAASGESELVPMARPDALVGLMDNAWEQDSGIEPRFEYLAGLAREVPSSAIRIRGLKKATDLILERILGGE